MAQFDDKNNKTPEIVKTEEEWQQTLTPMQFHVLREKGTERPFTGMFDKFDDPGRYFCAACGEYLFTSKAKFNSGCGWPSFFVPAEEGKINYHDDVSHGMVRTEVTCARCGGHLGHVFNDGPKPTGLRYCINSASLRFEADTAW
ncbi:MAG: peptide-methionine (R)-S-oxide reductase MsrB [Bacteroidales bacterium]|nr:peptide-methionine (R)-S-oxide reductase MsrB [Bacteroidales bacterium]